MKQNELNEKIKNLESWISKEEKIVNMIKEFSCHYEDCRDDFCQKMDIAYENRNRYFELVKQNVKLLKMLLEKEGLTDCEETNNEFNNLKVESLTKFRCSYCDKTIIFNVNITPRDKSFDKIKKLVQELGKVNGWIICGSMATNYSSCCPEHKHLA